MKCSSLTMTGLLIGLLVASSYSQQGWTAESGSAAVSQHVQVTRLQPVSHRLEVPGIGAGQGVFLHQGKVYLYGDGKTGIVREYTWSASEPGQLKYTGVEILLTRKGEDMAPHPTGLTHHPKFGTFLGDTVRQKGTIFHIDWDRAVADGNLDRAILNMVNDDLGVNGTRPEFVQQGDRWLIATSDYGGEQNELRFYDPARLQKVSRTSAEGVLVQQQSCGTFVQTLEWVPEWQTLALVQNQIAGLKYRLTFANWQNEQQMTFSAPFDLAQPTDELEGWSYLGEGWCLYLSSSSKNNVSIGRIDRTSKALAP